MSNFLAYLVARARAQRRAAHGPRGVRAAPVLPTLAAAWIFAQPDVTVPLVGASSPDQLDAVLAGAEQPLRADVLAALDEATAAFRRGVTE